MPGVKDRHVGISMPVVPSALTACRVGQPGRHARGGQRGLLPAERHHRLVQRLLGPCGVHFDDTVGDHGLGSHLGSLALVVGLAAAFLLSAYQRPRMPGSYQSWRKISVTARLAGEARGDDEPGGGPWAQPVLGPL
jgi:hypothetical protein